MDDAVKLLVVSPVFGYPGFLPETLECLLASRDAPEHRIILADDGCNFAETYEICMEAQTAFPQKIIYRRSAENAGLAAVRNASVKYGLDRFRNLECIIFLDADDRVSQSFLARSYEAFQETRERFEADGKKTGWIFEDPIFFGETGDMVRIRDDSPLWNLIGATHTSSSVMSADIFREGHYYEESMKAGSEDWEFWLRAREAGFSGAFCSDLGFSYRRRPGSMSKGAANRMEGNRALIRLRNKNQYRAASVAKQFRAEAYSVILLDENGAVHTFDARTNDVDPRIKTIPDLGRQLALSSGVAATALPPFVLFAERLVCEAILKNGYSTNILEFALAHREHSPVLKHVFGTARAAGHYPGESGIGTFGQVNGDNAHIISVSDRAIMEKIAAWNGPKQILDRIRQVNWSFKLDKELPRTATAIQVFEHAFTNISTEFKRQLPNSRRYKWRPQGLYHSEIPKYLTHTKNFGPLDIPENASLIVFDIDALEGPNAQADLKRLILRERGSGQVVYGLCGPHEPVKWIEAAFESVLQIPMTDTILGPVAKDEQRLVSYSLNFSRVVSFNVFAQNNGAKALKQNGIPCELYLSQDTASLVTFNGLFEAFKAYSSFLLDGSGDLDDLMEASGVAREKMQVLQ